MSRTTAATQKAGHPEGGDMPFTINHESEVTIDGYDVAACLGHDMELIISFIDEIDKALKDVEFPKAVLAWAEREIAKHQQPGDGQEET